MIKLAQHFIKFYSKHLYPKSESKILSVSHPSCSNIRYYPVDCPLNVCA